MREMGNWGGGCWEWIKRVGNEATQVFLRFSEVNM